MTYSMEDVVNAGKSVFLEQEKKRVVDKNLAHKELVVEKVDYSKVFTVEELKFFEESVSSEIESESYKEGYTRSSQVIRADMWTSFIKRSIPEGASHRGRMTGIFYKVDEDSLSADFWGDGSGCWRKSGLFNTTLNEDKYYVKL